MGGAAEQRNMRGENKMVTLNVDFMDAVLHFNVLCVFNHLS